jgi:undecaprenyl-diphosphatase
MEADSMFRMINTGDRRVMRRVMRRVNQWLPPRWIQSAAILASRAGDGWLWWAVGLGVLLFGGPSRIQVTGRERPCAVATSCWATLLPPDRFSFPSGHTISAFTVAVPLGWYYPSLMPGLLFCAFSVAVSRILLGLHYLSDVLAGIAIGVGIGLVMVRFPL